MQKQDSSRFAGTGKQLGSSAAKKNKKEPTQSGLILSTEHSEITYHTIIKHNQWRTKESNYISFPLKFRLSQLYELMRPIRERQKRTVLVPYHHWTNHKQKRPSEFWCCLSDPLARSVGRVRTSPETTYIDCFIKGHSRYTKGISVFTRFIFKPIVAQRKITKAVPLGAAPLALETRSFGSALYVLYALCYTI